MANGRQLSYGQSGISPQGVRAHGAETKIGIAVGHGFTQDRVPRTRRRVRRFSMRYARFSSTNPVLLMSLAIMGEELSMGVLLRVGFSFNGSVHEFIVDLDGYVRSRDFAFRHFGIDERFGVRVLDADGQHQCARRPSCATSRVEVAVSFHKKGRGR